MLESAEGEATNIKHGGVPSARKARSLLNSWEECIHDLLASVKHKFPLCTEHTWSGWTQLLMEVISEIIIVKNFHIFHIIGFVKQQIKWKKKKSHCHIERVRCSFSTRGLNFGKNFSMQMLRLCWEPVLTRTRKFHFPGNNVSGLCTWLICTCPSELRLLYGVPSYSTSILYNGHRLL